MPTLTFIDNDDDDGDVDYNNNNNNNNLIIYYLCALTTATRPIKNTAQNKGKNMQIHK